MASLENTTWPLPKFRFSVTGIPGSPVFQEVSGLESEAQLAEYRAGNGKLLAPIKMPGLQKVGNVTMKKGIFITDSQLWAWFSSITASKIVRSTIAVKLLDETGALRMIWTLGDAFPTKITGTDMKTDGNEVAVDTLEIAYETMRVTTG